MRHKRSKHLTLVENIDKSIFFTLYAIRTQIVDNLINDLCALLSFDPEGYIVKRLLLINFGSAVCVSGVLVYINIYIYINNIWTEYVEYFWF